MLPCEGQAGAWAAVICSHISVGQYQGTGTLLLLPADTGSGLQVALRLDDVHPEPEPQPPLQATAAAAAAAADIVPAARVADGKIVSLTGAVTTAELRVVEDSVRSVADVADQNNCRPLALRLTVELNRAVGPPGSAVSTGRRVIADALLADAAVPFETALNVVRSEGARCGTSGQCLPKWTEYVPQRWYSRELRLAVAAGTVVHAAGSILWACWQLCVPKPPCVCSVANSFLLNVWWAQSAGTTTALLCSALRLRHCAGCGLDSRCCSDWATD